MPVTDVLDKLRAASTSESDKGARFERMMRSAFRLDRTYRERFTDVWLWSDWPGRRPPRPRPRDPRRPRRIPDPRLPAPPRPLRPQAPTAAGAPSARMDQPA